MLQIWVSIQDITRAEARHVSPGYFFGKITGCSPVKGSPLDSAE